MSERENWKIPDNQLQRTPWGPADHVEKILPGIVYVSTPGHGGLVLSDSRLAMMPKVLRRANNLGGRPQGRFFEEDCAWALVALAFLDEWLEAGGTAEEGDRSVAKNYYPNAYEAFSGEVIPPGESYIKDKRVFEASNHDNWVVVSAINHDKDLVRVTATKGGNRNDIGYAERIFLVPKDEYHVPKGGGFVIDPTRHREIEDPT